MADQKAPMRAVRLTLQLDADTLDELADALETIARQAMLGEMTCGVSGGPNSGWIYELLQDPEQTHDRYHAQVREYLAALQSAAPAQGGGK